MSIVGTRSATMFHVKRAPESAPRSVLVRDRDGRLDGECRQPRGKLRRRRVTGAAQCQSASPGGLLEQCVVNVMRGPTASSDGFKQPTMRHSSVSIFGCRRSGRPSRHDSSLASVTDKRLAPRRCAVRSDRLLSPTRWRCHESGGAAVV